MPSRDRDVFVYNKTKEALLASSVEIADSLPRRLIGLLGRRSLKPDSGIWIIPANAIHSFGMLFSFDLILIDRDRRVVALRERVPPFSMTWPNPRAESVIELPSGTIAASRTEIGDQLLIGPFKSKPSGASSQPGLDGTINSSDRPMTEQKSVSENARPAGITALSIFFVGGAAISFTTCVSLLFPGSFLEPMWKLNPRAHEAFLSMGRWAVVLMVAVSASCAFAATGLLKRAEWGRRLAVIVLAINLAGDIANTLLGTDRRAIIGVPIAAALLAYLMSTQIRRYFRP